MNNKAQNGIEYLLILGSVILVVAVIIISLTLGPNYDEQCEDLFGSEYTYDYTTNEYNRFHYCVYNENFKEVRFLRKTNKMIQVD